MVRSCRHLALLGLASAALLSGAGCAPPDSPAPPWTLEGRWRASVTLPGGELPFGVDISARPDGGYAVALINGAERVAVETVRFEADRLLLDFPTFNNRLELTRDGDDFAGSLTLVKRGGVTQVMPLRLTRGASHRFYAGPQDVNADFGGTWRVTFTDDDGETTPAVGEFAQTNGHVTGTFRTPLGDYRFLAGEVRDRTLYLSTFDGAHAFLFIATQTQQGSVNGDFWSGTQWHERFEARRDANAALPDADRVSRLRAGVERVQFEFPDSAGRLVSSTADRYAGKVLIVALAGTWCPNCHDEAAFLAPFYAQRRARGLEVIGLMFEHLPEFAAAARQVDRFRERFDIQYELLLAGYSDKQDATGTLGVLEEVIAYPTMIVLDRAGRVRRIHTGFNGPGTGVHYEKFRAEFSAFIDQLLSEEEA